MAKHVADHHRPGPGPGRACPPPAGRPRPQPPRHPTWPPPADGQVAIPMRSVPPRWQYQPPPYLYPRRRPELGGVAVLLVLTVLAALVAPHAHTLRGLV